MAYYNEIDPFCCEVLKARVADGRLPEGQVDGRDVRKVRPDELPAGQVHLFAGIGGFAYAARLAGLPDDFDIWTAGFPCQDISSAGKGAGLHGTQSGLFFEITRLLPRVRRRPTWVLLENVPTLRTRGADRVLAEMEAIGYSIRPFVVGAWAVGAPHKRDRAWLVGRLVNAKGGRARAVPARPGDEGPRASDVDGPSERLADAEPDGCGAGGRVPSDEGEAERRRRESAGSDELADAGGERRQAARPEHAGQVAAVAACPWPSRPGEPQHEWEAARLLELPLGGAVDGIPARLVRLANRSALKAYGNAIVPQIAAEIFKACMKAEAE